MNLLNETITFEGKDLTTVADPSATDVTPDGEIIVSYTNNGLTPIMIDIILCLGQSVLANGIGGLLVSSTQTITITPQMVYNRGGITGTYLLEPDAREKTGTQRHLYQGHDFLIQPGSTINMYVHSDNIGDDVVDGLYYIVESMSGINVESVNGSSPIEIRDIIQDSENPSSTPEPISVDENGRVYISGDNNNTLDDFVNISGRINISKR